MLIQSCLRGLTLEMYKLLIIILVQRITKQSCINRFSLQKLLFKYVLRIILEFSQWHLALLCQHIQFFYKNKFPYKA